MLFDSITPSLEQLPNELILRILCSLDCFDSLICLIDSSRLYRTLFQRYPRGVLHSIYKHSREEYIVTALAVVALYGRLRPILRTFQNEDENKALCDRYAHAIPDFIEASSFLAQDSTPERIDYWLRMICNIKLPLNYEDHSEPKCHIPEEALDVLMDIHSVTRRYADDFAAGFVTSADDSSVDSGHGHGFGRQSLQERSIIFEAFYRLWTVCHCLQNLNYWNEDSSFDPFYVHDFMEPLLESFPSVTALSVQAVYLFLREKLKRITEPFLKSDRYTSHSSLEYYQRGWSYVPVPFAKDSFPSCIIQNYCYSPKLYKILIEGDPEDVDAQPFLKDECDLILGRISSERGLQHLFVDNDFYVPHILTLKFVKDIIEPEPLPLGISDDDLMVHDYYGLPNIRIYKKANMAPVRGNISAVDLDAVFWDDCRREKMGLFFPAESGGDFYTRFRGYSSTSRKYRSKPSKRAWEFLLKYMV